MSKNKNCIPKKRELKFSFRERKNTNSHSYLAEHSSQAVCLDVALLERRFATVLKPFGSGLITKTF